MKRLCSMRDALSDPKLLGDAMPGDTWAAWRILLIAAMGEPLTDEERPTFTALTGRSVEPLAMAEELWGIVGRRGGKTRAAATLAAYFAGLVDFTDSLVSGERAVLPIIASKTRQARKAFGYVVGIVEASPILSGLVINQTSEALALSTRVDVEIQPASWRGNRGDTYAAVLGDEVAFWRSDESANPDAEILNAIRPALATTGGPIVMITSPYAKRGEAYATWKRHHGEKGDPLIIVAQAASRTMNPSLPQKVVDRAMERDPSSASAEYLAQFRSDVEAFISREAIEAVVDTGVIERAPVKGVSYLAFVDPSGGSNDSMTMAIAHLEGDIAILDCIRERKPPFSPEAVVEEFATVLKSYGIATVKGDRYGGEWPAERFRVHGIDYRAAGKAKSDIYKELLPAVNGARVALLDSPRLALQLVGLERRTARGGRDSIDHSPGAHDDLCNSAAGVLTMALEAKPAKRRLGLGFELINEWGAVSYSSGQLQ